MNAKATLVKRWNYGKPGDKIGSCRIGKTVEALSDLATGKIKRLEAEIARLKKKLADCETAITSS